jgi:DNA-binding SARP family transcriptional activator
VRYQELRDARLVIQENHSIYEWTRTQSGPNSSSLQKSNVRGPACSVKKCAPRSSRLRNLAFALWFFGIASLAWETPAGASYVKLSAVDTISQSYQIPVTNPQDGTTLPSVLNVASATLDTTSPVNKNVHATNGQIYLSLQMSSGPIQRNYGSPLWGAFFSGLTPLPATALRYVTASGRRYVATRVNPINQTYNPDGTTDDGMVDATYYFTVPITNRRGTLVIAPTHTPGVQYEGFVGGSPVLLNVGGPTRIALSFPKKLTTTIPSPKKAVTPPGTTSASLLNILATALAGLLVGVVLLSRRRGKRRGRPVPVYVVGNAPAPKAPSQGFEQQPVTQPPFAVPPAKKIVGKETTLRIDVLGPLTISPVNAPASDPIRAIVAYLAMNPERTLTLEEIQTAIWPLTEDGTDIKKPAMRNYMVDARRTVGERHLPTASGRAGYQLRDFSTDWSEFQDLLSEATKTSKETAVVLRRRALDLAKGPPFSADTTRYFTWTFTPSVVYKMVDAVSTLAHGLGIQFVLAGDLTTAQVVLRQGLLTDPASLTLWEDLTDVLLESTDQSLLALHWKAASLVLHAQDVVALRSRVHG